MDLGVIYQGVCGRWTWVSSPMWSVVGGPWYHLPGGLWEMELGVISQMVCGRWTWASSTRGSVGDELGCHLPDGLFPNDPQSRGTRLVAPPATRGNKHLLFRVPCCNPCNKHRGVQKGSEMALQTAIMAQRWMGITPRWGHGAWGGVAIARGAKVHG